VLGIHIAYFRDGDAFHELLEKFRVWYSVDLNMIGFVEVGIGRGQSVRPLGIVGKEQQPFAGFVQSANRKYSLTSPV